MLAGMLFVRTCLRILLCMALALQGAALSGRANASSAPPPAMAHHGCHDMAMGAAAPMAHSPPGQGSDQGAAHDGAHHGGDHCNDPGDAACRIFCASHCAPPLLPGVALQLLTTPMPEPVATVVHGRPPPPLPDPIRPPIV